MGQPITVAAKPSSNPRLLRFEINRSLTGMGHERYRSIADVVDDRPVDELARRILEHGGVDAVHVNSNIITVELSGGSTGAGLGEVIERLFRFYGDSDAPSSAGALTEEEATPEGVADPADVTDETIDDAPDPSGPRSGPSGQVQPGEPTGHSGAEDVADAT